MRVLIAEDEPISRRLLEAKLAKWGYEVVATGDGLEAWTQLTAEDAPRLAILDWMMPGLDGVEVCRRIRAAAKEPYTYIILLTALQGDEDIVAGLEAGADDYIVKPFKSNELNVRLRAGRRITELQNQLIEAREALRIRATHDPLTGLWNHEEILQIAQRELDRAERESSDFALIIADLDFFKKVNDTYGHLAGDEVLRIASARFRHAIRSYDSVGRYGGEEFLIILPGCCRECGEAIAERIRAEIFGHKMETTEGMIPVTVSLGLAVKSKSRPQTLKSILQAADQALYRAKGNGRNRVEIAIDQP